MKSGIEIKFAGNDSPSTSLLWRKIDEQERVDKVKLIIKDFNQGEKVEVEKAYINGQVTISLNEVMSASERGVFLLDLEEYIKKMLDNGITIWHEPIGDKNSMRKLRGVEVISIEEL